MLVSISVLFAIKEALNSARKDGGLSGWWTLSKYQDQKDLLNLLLCRAINFYIVMQNEKYLDHIGQILQLN